MKKTLMATFVAVTFILLTVSTAFAANTKYTLDKLNMTIEVPEDFATITRDSTDSDPDVKLFGFTSAKESTDLLKEYDGYLNTSPKNGEYGILVTMVSDKSSKNFFDLNLLNEKETEKMIDKIIKAQSKKIQYSDHKVYKHKQAKFIKLNGMIRDGTEKSYISQYFTIYNGQTININLFTYDGPASESAQLKQKEIVDTINFTKKIDRPFSILHITGKPTVDTIIVCVGIVAIIAIIIGIFKHHKRKSLDNE